MNFKNSFLAFVFICSSVAIAHDIHNLPKEQLAIIAVNVLEQNALLRKELDKLKHKLDDKHRVHELEKAIIHLLK
jgi:uncharacterized small protein (DUF1192 family)